MKDTADCRAVAKAAAKIQKVVDSIVPPKEADEDDEILAGVAFGPDFYNRVGLCVIRMNVCVCVCV